MTDDKLWKRAGGRPRHFDEPEQLWEAACNYFQWVEDNPLWEDKPFHYQGTVVDNQQTKMRAMTEDGLCLHMAMSLSSWSDYCRNPKFSAVCMRIKAVIRDQKFAGAAAELLNPSIIARDLGLAEKRQLEGAGENGEHLLEVRFVGDED